MEFYVFAFCEDSIFAYFHFINKNYPYMDFKSSAILMDYKLIF